MARFLPLNVQILAVCSWSHSYARILDRCSAQNMLAWLLPDSAKKNWHFLSVKKKKKSAYKKGHIQTRIMADYMAEIGHPNRPKYGHNFVILRYIVFRARYYGHFLAGKQKIGHFSGHFLFNFSTRELSQFIDYMYMCSNQKKFLDHESYQEILICK